MNLFYILCKLNSKNLRRSGMNNSAILSTYISDTLGLKIPIADSYQELRFFLTGEKGECEVCKNETLLKNARLMNGPFNQFCSKECEMKWRSKRQMENNTVYRIKDRKKWKDSLSVSAKNAIAEGRFTPNVTNSWCNSRISIVINDKIVNVRSSWEAYFLLKNPDLGYEKIRIPYIDSDGKKHSYIVDFVDARGNLYEIKPSSNIGKSSEKFLAAEKYCRDKNVEFNIITEDYFKNPDFSLLKDQPSADKLLKLLRKYENKTNNKDRKA